MQVCPCGIFLAVRTLGMNPCVFTTREDIVTHGGLTSNVFVLYAADTYTKVYTHFYMFVESSKTPPAATAFRMRAFMVLY